MVIGGAAGFIVFVVSIVILKIKCFSPFTKKQHSKAFELGSSEKRGLIAPDHNHELDDTTHKRYEINRTKLPKHGIDGKMHLAMKLKEQDFQDMRSTVNKNMNFQHWSPVLTSLHRPGVNDNCDFLRKSCRAPFGEYLTFCSTLNQALACDLVDDQCGPDAKSKKRGHQQLFGYPPPRYYCAPIQM